MSSHLKFVRKLQTEIAKFFNNPLRLFKVIIIYQKAN